MKAPMGLIDERSEGRDRACSGMTERAKSKQGVLTPFTDERAKSKQGGLSPFTDERILRLFPLFFLFLFTLNTLFAQAGSGSSSSSENTVSLAAGISRLEKISAGAGSSPKERFEAFLSLSWLYKLCGDAESALKACDHALVIFPSDGRALLDQSRLLISMGEYEKAAASLNALFARNQDHELLLQGRYLSAMLEAFRYGYSQSLAALAEEPGFAEYRSGIYYTLWKLTGLSSWQARLSAEFPLSPEAKITGGAANSMVYPASTALWLLFPGRDNVLVSSPPPSQGSQSTAAPVVSASPAVSAATTVSAAPAPSAATAVSTMPAVSAATAVSTTPAASAATAVSTTPASSVATTASVALLQTGLFSSEDNAKILGERLTRAGFEPRITLRRVNDKDFYAVLVSGGTDMNAMIKKLKDAGFESFPVR